MGFGGFGGSLSTERMKIAVIKPDVAEEFFTSEQCFILEVWNTPEDADVSIARARVEPGVATKLHYLEGIHERYLIVSGKGSVMIGDLPPTEVGAGDIVVIPKNTSQSITNIGDTDLIFYCICSPRFIPESYKQINGSS